MGLKVNQSVPAILKEQADVPAEKIEAAVQASPVPSDLTASFYKLAAQGSQQAVEVSEAAQAVTTQQPAQVTGGALVSETEAEALVNEMLDLQRRIDTTEADKMIKRKDEVRKMILDLPEIKDFPKDEVITLTTERGVVIFSAASEKLELPTDSKKALMDKLGLDLFIQLANFTVTDLRKVLSELELKSMCVKKEGSRTLKAVQVKQ